MERRAEITEENNSKKDEEEVVTIEQMIEEFEERAETANLLLGGQDDTICTYPEGYKPRQALFACITCTPSEASPAGICYGCSMNCHADHELIELYTKRSFKCDCGNSKFNGKRCNLYEEKNSMNEFNSYNHNFQGLFCVCNDTYPSENTNEDMIQCTICEDWFHLSHLNLKDPDAENVTSNVTSLVCLNCSQKLPFLHYLNEKTSDKECFSTKNLENIEKIESILVEDLRARMCKCENCLKLYGKYQCEYLLDDEDDLVKYEEENKKKANEEKEKHTESDTMRELVGHVGMEGAIKYLSEVNELKRKMSTFFEEKNVDNGVIKAEDVKSFFDKMKEERLEAKRAKMEEKNQ